MRSRSNAIDRSTTSSHGRSRASAQGGCSGGGRPVAAVATSPDVHQAETPKSEFVPIGVELLREIADGHDPHGLSVFDDGESAEAVRS